MSYASVNASLELSDREHTWRDSAGVVCSVVDLGTLSVTFDSPADARAVAARCVRAADAMDALAAEGAPAKEGTDG